MQISNKDENKILSEELSLKIVESNKKYYKDVLDFLNMLFENNEESILRIKITKILLNSDILETYNYIIKKYSMEKDLIDVDSFNIDHEYSNEEVSSFICTMCNNLLQRLDYKIKLMSYNNKKYLKIYKN